MWQTFTETAKKKEKKQIKMLLTFAGPAEDTKIDRQIQNGLSASVR